MHIGCGIIEVWRADSQPWRRGRREEHIWTDMSRTHTWSRSWSAFRRHARDAQWSRSARATNEQARVGG